MSRRAVTLYRLRGAQGVATHFSAYGPVGLFHGFEPLGQGVVDPVTGAVSEASCPCFSPLMPCNTRLFAESWALYQAVCNVITDAQLDAPIPALGGQTTRQILARIDGTV